MNDGEIWAEEAEKSRPAMHGVRRKPLYTKPIPGDRQHKNI